MSVIFATQLTAAATTALAVFAIVTAAFAFLAYRKQALEVGLLLEQNERAADDRRRAQAARVFIGVPHDPGRMVAPYAVNASDLPAYDAQLWYLNDLSSPGDHEDLGIILSGERPDGQAQLFLSSAYATSQTILTFRDAAGVRWMRVPGGALKEQSGPTAGDSVLAFARDAASDPQNQHNLPDGYDQLDDHYTPPVLDSIAIHPRSRGRLNLSGLFSTGTGFTHTVKVVSTDPDNQGVYIEKIQHGSGSGQRVSYDILNHRDSPSSAQIILVLTDPSRPLCSRRSAQTPREDTANARPRTPSLTP